MGTSSRWVGNESWIAGQSGYEGVAPYIAGRSYMWGCSHIWSLLAVSVGTDTTLCSWPEGQGQQKTGEPIFLFILVFSRFLHRANQAQGRFLT